MKRYSGYSSIFGRWLRDSDVLEVQGVEVEVLLSQAALEWHWVLDVHPAKARAVDRDWRWGSGAQLSRRVSSQIRAALSGQEA